ncbi:unnamed protein product [Prorocentrum cordatum]|uniref:Uncharacterized protein n=1 Tax=Prorocentrum cordatum TaxID=2364126 RepID=A0ABN9VRW0_9DINO|nr:unnamed protein product [Polarella glacialis]
MAGLAAALRRAAVAGCVLLRAAGAGGALRGGAAVRGLLDGTFVANFVTGQMEDVAWHDTTGVAIESVVRGMISVTGTFSASQASSLTGHLTDMVMQMSGLPGLLFETTLQGPGMLEYTFLLLPDDASEANALVSAFFQSWTPGTLLSKLTLNKDADASLGGVSLTQAKLDTIQQAFQLALTPEPTLTSLTTTRSTVTATTTTVTIFTGEATVTASMTLTAVSDATTTTTIHTTTSSHATATVPPTTSTTSAPINTASSVSATHASTTTTVASSRGSTTGANAVSNAALDTSSAGSGDVETVLTYVLCGASFAVLIACAGAALVRCQSLPSEELHARLGPPRPIRVFRAPIQRVNTVVSARSCESPKARGRSRSSPTCSCSLDTFFGQPLPGVSPDMRRPDFFRTAPPEVPTLSPGPVFRPASFSDGPEARRGPPGAETSEKPPVLIFLRRHHVWVLPPPGARRGGRGRRAGPGPGLAPGQRPLRVAGARAAARGAGGRRRRGPAGSRGGSVRVGGGPLNLNTLMGPLRRLVIDLGYERHYRCSFRASARSLGGGPWAFFSVRPTSSCSPAQEVHALVPARQLGRRRLFSNHALRTCAVTSVGRLPTARWRINNNCAFLFAPRCSASCASCPACATMSTTVHSHECR